MKIGIDALAFDTPKIHLPIRTLASARNINADKLEKGLGLLKMTIPDKHQDVVVFGANAMSKLIIAGKINPKDISRIYVGSESAIDGAKPISSYIISLMEKQYGENSFSQCDVVDFIFACIGGIDALQNCIDFIRVNPDKKAIVITTDIAKYDLESTGEYTQGAGAVALLISKDPQLIAFENLWSTSTKGTFDFFKPRRVIQKEAVTGNTNNEAWFDILEKEIEVHQDQPVFDGQYSNQCYMSRTRQAYFSFKKLKNIQDTLYKEWESIIMHLPYAFQGRRMLTEIFALDNHSKTIPMASDTPDYQTQLKNISKTEDYKDFVEQKLMPSEIASSNIGNLYTGSIFMALLSTLYYHYKNQKEIQGTVFGFLAYGSGSKSKVFEGTIQKGWKKVIENQHLFETIELSTSIDMNTYIQLYKKEKTESIIPPSREWILERIETKIPHLLGARYYKWIN